MDMLSLLVLMVLVLLVVNGLLLLRSASPAQSLRGLADAVTHIRLALQGLTGNIQSVEHGQRQVQQSLGAVNVSLAKAETEVRALGERVEKVEGAQQHANHTMATLRVDVAQTDALSRSIAETAETIRTQITQTHYNLTSLQTLVKARQTLDVQTADAVKRLETVLTGSQTKGAAGEYILEQVFAKLPVEWQVRDFRVGDKHVEFGLRLPNNLVVPIDSKWPATSMLEQFLRCEDLQEQRRLKGEIQRAVLNKAKDVRKYLDPSLTMPFGIAAIPDAIYDLCTECHVEAFKLNVVLISYSLFVPYLLLVFQTALRTERSIDLQRVAGYVQSVQDSVQALQETLEGRLSRALTMLGNARDEMRLHLGRAAMGVTSLRSNTCDEPGALPPQQEA